MVPPLGHVLHAAMERVRFASFAPYCSFVIRYVANIIDNAFKIHAHGIYSSPGHDSRLRSAVSTIPCKSILLPSIGTARHARCDRYIKFRLGVFVCTRIWFVYIVVEETELETHVHDDICVGESGTIRAQLLLLPSVEAVADDEAAMTSASSYMARAQRSSDALLREERNTTWQ